jgi:hypothetical protein
MRTAATVVSSGDGDGREPQQRADSMGVQQDKESMCRDEVRDIETDASEGTQHI